MTDLEDRIREALRDPRRQLPDWPDPMPRIRRAARRQNAGLAVAAAILLAGLVVPLAFMSGLGTHASGSKPSDARTPSTRAATPAYPSWTKQLHGEVAYKCGDYICLMHPDGTGRQVLFPGNGPWPQWDPAWSPDGRRLAFRGYYGSGDGQYDLYAVDATGCHLTRLTHQMNGTSSAWSPAGSQIAFSVPFGIYVINADGTGLRRLIVNASHYSYGVDAPAWSVRNRIAFVRYVAAQHAGEIYTTNADGSGQAPLTHGAPGFGQPSWSPDGKSIAFVANPSSSSDIEVANADGTGTHRVSPRSWTSYSPTWTPDGKIVFLRQTGAPTATTDAPTSAYIVNRDGASLRLIYPNLNATQITWGRTTIRAGC
jgi:eukaryotic-like serine/threonine-protein kinase